MTAPRIVLTEEQLQRITVDAVAGKRVLPADPSAHEVARKIWAEVDALKSAGSIVDVPPSLP
jgi:hypothetical protein